NRGRDAEPPGRILRIGDSQIDAVGGDDVLQMVGHNPSPGRRENVADKEDVHYLGDNLNTFRTFCYRQEMPSESRHRRSVNVRPVDECETLDELLTQCFPAFGGAYLRRIYGIL